MLRKVAVTLAVGTASCASIVQGPIQRVAFYTQPPGATVHADAQSCTTPCSLPLRRNRDVDAHIAKDGYAGAQVPVRHQLDPWIVGNLAFMVFAPIGAAVDVVSGSAFQLYPAAVMIPLRPLSPPAKAAPVPGRPAPEKPVAPGAKPRGPEAPEGEWKEIPSRSRDL